MLINCEASLSVGNADALALLDLKLATYLLIFVGQSPCGRRAGQVIEICGVRDADISSIKNSQVGGSV